MSDNNNDKSLSISAASIQGSPDSNHHAASSAKTTPAALAMKPTTPPDGPRPPPEPPARSPPATPPARQWPPPAAVSIVSHTTALPAVVNTHSNVHNNNNNNTDRADNTNSPPVTEGAHVAGLAGGGRESPSKKEKTQQQQQQQHITNSSVNNIISASNCHSTSHHTRTRSNELPPVSNHKVQSTSTAHSSSPQHDSGAVVTPPPLRPLSGGLKNAPQAGNGAAVGGGSACPVAATAATTTTTTTTGGATAASAASPNSAASSLLPAPATATKKKKISAAEELMESRSLTAILQEFVRDAYRDTPEDVIAYMAEWALRRRPPHPPSSPPAIGVDRSGIGSNHSGTAAQAASGGLGGTIMSSSLSPGRPSTVSSARSASSGGIMSLNLERPPSQGHVITRRLLCVVLGAEKSNKEQLLAMLDTLAPSEDGGVGPKMGSALKDLLGSCRDKIEAARLESVALVPCESDRMGGCIVFADLPANEISKSLISLTAMADLACIVVSARHGVADMVQQRAGELYGRLLLAHSVGVKHAFAVLTDTRGVAPPVVENVEKEVRLMFQRCGFDPNLVQIVRGTNSSDVLFDSIARVQVQKRVPFTLKPASRMKATMIVLYGTGVRSGDRMSVFSHGHFEVRIDGIPTLIDRKTHEVTDHNLGVLKRNQVATLELSVIGNVRPQTSISANILAYSGGRVIAMGNVAEMFLDQPVPPPSGASAESAQRRSLELSRHDDDDDDEEDEDEKSDDEEEFALPAGNETDLAAAKAKQQKLVQQAEQKTSESKAGQQQQRQSAQLPKVQPK